MYVDKNELLKLKGRFPEKWAEASSKIPERVSGEPVSVELQMSIQDATEHANIQFLQACGYPIDDFGNRISVEDDNE